MNIHVSNDIREKFRCLEFRGKPFKYKGRTIIRAHHYALNMGFYYSFEEDFAWFKDCEMPDKLLLKV